MNHDIADIIERLQDLNDHIHRVADISDKNTQILLKSIDGLMEKTEGAALAPAVAIAGIAIALEKKGMLDRKDIIEAIAGLTSSMLPPEARADAFRLIETIIGILDGKAHLQMRKKEPYQH